MAEEITARNIKVTNEAGQVVAELGCDGAFPFFSMRNPDGGLEIELKIVSDDFAANGGYEAGVRIVRDGNEGIELIADEKGYRLQFIGETTIARLRKAREEAAEKKREAEYAEYLAVGDFSKGIPNLGIALGTAAGTEETKLRIECEGRHREWQLEEGNKGGN